MPFKNPEKKKAYNRMYRERNLERLQEYDRQRYWTQRKDDPVYQARARDYHQRWYRENKSRLRRVQRIWVQENRGKLRAATQRWRRRHPGAERARKRAYLKENPERSRIWSANRLARQTENGGRCSVHQWLGRYQFYGECCAYCGKHLRLQEAQMDHVIPLAAGGQGWPSNIVPACPSCNMSKGTRRILPAWLRKATGQNMPRQVVKES